MKTFQIEEIFPVSVQAYFDVIYKDDSFKKSFHIGRGDKDVDVSEWIPQADQTFQRICFYSMVENAGTGNKEGEVSRCLEIEKYEWQKEADENFLIVHSAVTPENIGLGNIFKITAKWKITPCNSSECRIVVIGEVECTKRMWGLQNIAEGYLYNLASESMKQWLSNAREKLKQVELQNKSEKKENYSTGHQIRMRAMRELQTVVSGTEKLVKMLSDTTWTAPDDVDEEMLQGGSEHCLSRFAMDPPHMHSDEDLISKKNINGPKGKSSKWVFLILGALLVVGLIFWYSNYSVLI